MSQDKIHNLNIQEIIKNTINQLQKVSPEASRQLIEDVARFHVLTGEPASHYYRFIKIKQVKEMTGHSEPSIYRLVTSRTLPAPVKLSPNSNARGSAWVYGAIVLWVHDRLTGNDQEAA
jgi:predicted DNA-binding transcriptional regulator AlpA